MIQTQSTTKIITIITNSKKTKGELHSIAYVMAAGPNTALLILDGMKNFDKKRIASYRYWSGKSINK